jgi:hypothetical protein
MLNIYEILGILFIHWFADFVLQTDKQAKGKSKNWTDLLMHTTTYSFIWFIIGIVYFFNNADFVNLGLYNDDLFARCVIIFPGITFIAHTITDYFTSRLNSKLWEQGKVHNFFVSIGFDQVLHYLQLFLTYYYLVKC